MGIEHAAPTCTVYDVTHQSSLAVVTGRPCVTTPAMRRRAPVSIDSHSLPGVKSFVVGLQPPNFSVVSSIDTSFEVPLELLVHIEEYERDASGGFRSNSSACLRSEQQACSPAASAPASFTSVAR